MLAAAGSGRARAADPDALWKIVGGECVPGARLRHDPAPCVAVDLAGGTAILKDRNGATQFLLIPTTRITGIESPSILADAAPNYFARAWDATALVGQRAGHALPRRDFALAINAEPSRSQNQLHIHVDCIRQDIRAVLDQLDSGIGPHWQTLPRRLALHRYRALRIDGDRLGATNPFRLLAASLRDPAAEMGQHTLVLVGDTDHGRPGFILLDGESGPLTLSLTGAITRLKLGPGAGEELEDHSCRIADGAATR